MIEEDSEPLTDDDEMESDTSVDSHEKDEEGIGRIFVATEEVVQSKTKEKPTLMFDGASRCNSCPMYAANAGVTWS